jgi:hypothetical protein
MSGRFSLVPMEVALPPGAFAGGGRDVLRHDGRSICAFTRGALRPCLHPVWTPAAFVVTAEQPADHPHHSGIWCASDHVALLHRGPDGIERYDYAFYVDDVFQGRAPGRIRQTSLVLVEQTDTRADVVQQLEWTGPREWGAPDGRPVLREQRTTSVTVADRAFVFDIVSEVMPAGETSVALGPTRHAWFNARVADGIALHPLSAPIDNQGRRGAAAIPTRGPSWVDYSGPVGGGAEAGITVAPANPEGQAWFVSDWGVLTVGSIRDGSVELAQGKTARFACRFVAHDGPLPDLDVPKMREASSANATSPIKMGSTR